MFVQLEPLLTTAAPNMTQIVQMAQTQLVPATQQQVAERLPHEQTIE